MSHVAAQALLELAGRLTAAGVSNQLSITFNTNKSLLSLVGPAGTTHALQLHVTALQVDPGGFHGAAHTVMVGNGESGPAMVTISQAARGSNGSPSYQTSRHTVPTDDFSSVTSLLDAWVEYVIDLEAEVPVTEDPAVVQLQAIQRAMNDAQNAITFGEALATPGPVERAQGKELVRQQRLLAQLQAQRQQILDDNHWSLMGDWIVECANSCTCGQGHNLYPHEPGCGYEPVAPLHG